MATILIVEDDDLLARQMAHTLHQAGHVPILARDARAALRATRERPEAMLLDLDVSELSMETVLAELERGSGTARIPLFIVTGQREAVAHLKATDRAAIVLRKPVSGVHLRESVDTLLGPPAPPAAPALQLDQPRQRQLILHLIAHGSDPLALQISRRLCLDRVRGTHPQAGETLTWEEIAAWGHREGLLDLEQAQLMGRMPTPGETRVAAP
jgi:DNA-binding response OmpR family regulator